MDPLNAPLPTAWYLPFQLVGIQSSTLMSESADGASVIATRQNAGSDRWSFGRSEGLNPPAATASTCVIVPCGSASFVRSAQANAPSTARRCVTVAMTTAHEAPTISLMTPSQSLPNVKVSSIDTKTGTGSPFLVPGANIHWFAALIAS